MNITVIGSGVSGLSCAVALARRFPAGDGHCVRIITAHDYSRSTSMRAAAVWYPYDVDSEDKADVTRWGEITFNELVERYLPYSDRAGVHLAMGIELFRGEERVRQRPPWADTVAAIEGGQFEQRSYDDLVRHHGLPATPRIKYAGGYVFTTILVEMPTYLAYLVSEFRDLSTTRNPADAITTNVVISDRDLQRSAQGTFDHELLAGEDVIVNCTGVQARTVANDPDVHASLGRVIYAPLEPLRHLLYDEASNRWRTLLDGDLEGEELTYLVPRPLDSICVVGGTAIPIHWDAETQTWPDQSSQEIADIERGILDRCDALLPGVKEAACSVSPLQTGVGLRPKRDSGVALFPREPNPEEHPLLVTNYGHGGSGVTLSWGCAAQVVSVVDTWLNARSAAD
jgi:D-amino-acid oxidase